MAGGAQCHRSPEKERLNREGGVSGKCWWVRGGSEESALDKGVNEWDWQHMGGEEVAGTHGSSFRGALMEHQKGSRAGVLFLKWTE